MSDERQSGPATSKSLQRKFADIGSTRPLTKAQPQSGQRVQPTQPPIEKKRGRPPRKGEKRAIYSFNLKPSVGDAVQIKGYKQVNSVIERRLEKSEYYEALMIVGLQHLSEVIEFLRKNGT